jgi:pentatricopeptide repeat protein
MDKRLDDNTTLGLLECCLKQGSDGRDIFDWQKDVMDTRCFTTYIKALCKSGSLDKAVSVFNKMKERFNPKECPYHTLIESFARTGNLPEAFKYFVKAKSNDITLRTNTYNTLIEAYVKVDNVPKAWDLLEDMRNSKIEADSYTYTCIFKAIKENKSDLLKASELLKSLEDESSVALDVILYNILLDAFVSNRMLFNACELLDRMELAESIIKPDEISYNTIIKGCGQTKNLSKAFEFLNRMKKCSVKPNEVTYNSLIDVCVRCGELDSAWSLLPAMESSGLTPDNFTYSTLIKGIYPRNDKGGLKKAFDLFNAMKSKGKVKPDEILYNCLMDVCVRYRDTYKAVAVFNEMELMEVKPSAITYGILIKAYGQANQLDNAFKVFKKMQNEGHNPNAVTYGCLIDSCIKNGAISKAQSIYDKMLRDGIRANTIINTTLIKGFTKTKNLKGALQIYQKMKSDSNSLPNNVTYNSLLDCCTKCNDLNMLETVFEEMKKTENKPDLITFSTVIKGYCKSGKLSSALRLLETMEEKHIKPDEVLFNSLLDGCAKRGELEIALEIYTKMNSASIKPSDITYSILLKAITRSNIKTKDVVMKGKEVIINMLTILSHTDCLKEAVELLEKVKTERLGKSIYSELMKTCIMNKEWDKAAVVAMKSLKENPEYGKGEVIYKDLVNKLLEVKNPIAESISELLDKQVNESKQMFKPIIDSGNRTFIKSEVKEKSIQGKGSENMNMHNMNKKSTNENRLVFAVEESVEGKKSEHFIAKPIDFDAIPYFKNSKVTESKNTAQSKIPRLV